MGEKGISGSPPGELALIHVFYSSQQKEHMSPQGPSPEGLQTTLFGPVEKGG